MLRLIVQAAPLATTSNPLPPLQIAVLLVLLDVPPVREEVILSVPAAPLVTISNLLLLQLLAQVLVQVLDTIQIPEPTPVLHATLLVPSAQEEVILNVPAAPLATF